MADRAAVRWFLRHGIARTAFAACILLCARFAVLLLGVVVTFLAFSGVTCCAILWRET